jgi:hypothetical protein
MCFAHASCAAFAAASLNGESSATAVSFDDRSHLSSARGEWAIAATKTMDRTVERIAESFSSFEKKESLCNGRSQARYPMNPANCQPASESPNRRDHSLS